MRVLLGIQRRHHGVAVGQAHQVITERQSVDVQVQLQIFKGNHGIAGKHLQQALLQGVRRYLQCRTRGRHRQHHTMGTGNKQMHCLGIKAMALGLQGLLQTRPHGHMLQGAAHPMLAVCTGRQHIRRCTGHVHSNGDLPLLLARRGRAIAVQQNLQLAQ